jgi:AraC-like DNA-binding protein
MSKQVESNLFILSSFKQSREFYQHLLSGITTYEGLATRILKQIEAAHAFRQVERVRELARILINIPIREFQLTAQYYLVWCKCRELDYHNEVLERIIEQSQTCKTRALFSRGAFEWYNGNNEAAFYFYSEALKTSPTVSEYVDLSRTIAVLKGTEGFHRSAIREFENLLPVIKYAEPRVYYDFLNSYAVELMQNHRLSEARNTASIAVSSPFGPFYPEWQETWSEVRTKQKRRSTVTISRTLIEQEDEAEPEAPENTIRNLRIQTVIGFMNSNLDRRVSLSELASIVSLSPSHLSRLFKNETKLSPGEYLIRLRMEKARHLLATSFLSIKQIMALIGYGNRKDFVGHFKRYFGLAPSQYRKRAFTLD